MDVNAIIDAEKWDRDVFDSEEEHNMTSSHNASLNRIAKAVRDEIDLLERKIVNLQLALDYAQEQITMARESIENRSIE